MLQQTQVSVVIPHYERWMGVFPDVTTLAGAPEEAVLRAWTGLGYYTRARNIHRAARLLAGSGHWPLGAVEWRRLPGIGPYTAGAIASLAFDQREPILDGNVARVLSRFAGLEFLPGDGAREGKVYWELARLWADTPKPGEINEALMELGALVCVPGTPRCDQCPLRRICRARAHGWTGIVPPPKRRKPASATPAVAVRARRDGHLLLETRPPGSFLAGHLMFPFFTGTDAARWKKRFTESFPGWKLSRIRAAGSLRHMIMTTRFEVEVVDAVAVRTGATAAAEVEVEADAAESLLSSALALKILRT